MRTTERSKMVFVLLIVMAMVLAACGDSSSDTTTTAAAGDDEPTATTSAPTETTEAMTEETDAPMAEGEPIIIGSTLALTGFLSPTAAIHKVAGELFVEQLNESGGLLGRPVEWVVLDDESVPDQAAALYERLITEDEVDLLVGPYGTGTITAGMAVAQRYGYVFPQHTGSLTYACNYECQFPAWPTGRYPNLTTPNLVYDALESTGTPPETIGFVINQVPGTVFVAQGYADGEGDDLTGAVQIAEERGYEVVLDVQFPSNISDWGPIAAQVRDADPDFLYVGALGVDGPNLIAAMDALDYRPGGMFFQWPAPGPLLGADAEGAMSVTAFEPHPPFTDNAKYAAVAEAFSEAAAEAGIPYTAMETQASASWAAWEILVNGVEGAGSLDNGAVCDYLVNNEIETIFGGVDFDADQSNYYGDLSFVKQIQDGDWWVVYPEEFAAPGRSVQYSPGG